MEKKNVIDKRSIQLERLLKKDFIPFLSGRPKREKVIGQEDITNLTIALNTTDSVESFLRII